MEMAASAEIHPSPHVECLIAGVHSSILHHYMQHISIGLDVPFIPFVAHSHTAPDDYPGDLLADAVRCANNEVNGTICTKKKKKKKRPDREEGERSWR